MYIPELKREIETKYVNGLIAFVDYARDVSKTDAVFDMSEAFRHTDTNKLSLRKSCKC